MKDEDERYKKQLIRNEEKNNNEKEDSKWRRGKTKQI